MQTVAELYSTSGLPIASLAADPSMVLIENTETHFGLLLSEGCWQDSFSPRLMLDRVRWVRIATDHVRLRDLEQVCLEIEGGLAIARDVATGYWLPNASEVSYKLFFMDEAEFASLERTTDGAVGAFLAAQRRYGTLPGFGARDLGLTSPENYAMVAPDPGANFLLKAG